MAFFGRYTWKKGFSYFLQLCETSSSSFKFHAAGSDDEGALNAHILLNPKSEIVDHGFLSGDSKFLFLERADVFVLNTHGENFGISIVEALQAGCIVLISDNTPFSSQIVNSRAGFRISSRTSEMLDILNTILHDSKLRVEYQQNARALGRSIAAQCNSGSLIDRYETIARH